MKQINFLLFVLGSIIGAWLLLIGAYSLRSEYTLAVGELGTGPYVSGFNGDEAGVPRHRWTGGPKLAPGAPALGLITLPLTIDASKPASLRVIIRAARDRTPPEVSFSVNGLLVGKAQAEAGIFKTVEFPLTLKASPGDNTVVEIRSESFRVAGDSRGLGVQVAEVKLLTAPTLRLPPLDVVGWAGLYVLAVGLLLGRLLPGIGQKRLWWSMGAGVVALMPWLLLPGLLPAGLHLWYSPFYLQILAVITAVAALVTWREPATNWLVAFLVRLEQERHFARNILLAALFFYTLYAFIIIMNMDYIGHADYADNAVAARNIVQGRGYSLDYAAQFYQRYQLPRPADTWPPLQPFLIVPFFAIFGPTTWAAKLPNLLLVPALAGAIFYYGSRLFNRRTALGAALLTPLAIVPAFGPSPAFFETIAYPINDLAFTLLAFLSLSSLYLFESGFKKASTSTSVSNVNLETQSDSLPVSKSSVKSKITRTRMGKNLKSKILWAGLWAGLLFLSKPSGAVLLVVAGGWLLWRKYLGRPKIWLPWKELLLTVGVALLVVSPFLIRNLWQFGTVYESTERFDAWVTKWYPPDERIYDLYTPFSSKELPNPRQLLEYGWDSNLNAIHNQFKRFSSHLWDGELFPPLLLILAGLGIAVLPGRRYGLAVLVVLCLVVYLLIFTILWHYEPRYFLMWIPWTLLFGLYGLSWLYDKMVGNSLMESSPTTEPRSSAKTAPWLVAAVVLMLAVPGLAALAEHGPAYTKETGIVATANWLKENTSKDAVIMSRNIWELSFHSERPSVMIPNNASMEQVKNIMREYSVRYLQLDHLNPDDRVVNRQWGQRSALWNLLDKRPQAGKETAGFKLVYDRGGLIVYEWDGQ